MSLHKTWWGAEFVTALEGFIDAGRLQRGRAYRSDKRIIKFSMDKNTVNATIRGNINPYFGVTKEPRYKVSLQFKALTKEKWQPLIESLVENAGWLSKLMLNEIPRDIQLAFGEEPFLPAKFSDLNARCSCPDHENPCKHIAGVYYRIAALLDTSPMLLFPLRGFSLEALHHQLTQSDLGQAFSEHLSTPETVLPEYAVHRFTPVEQVKIPSKVHQSNFWHLGGWESDALLNDEEPHISASLIKKQGDYPPFWERQNSFITAMDNVYQIIKNKNKKSIVI